jgi:hypothetical protein
VSIILSRLMSSHLCSFPVGTVRCLLRKRPTQALTPRAQNNDVLRIKTPHSGFHLDGAQEFMEGWYFRVGCELYEMRLWIHL